MADDTEVCSAGCLEKVDLISSITLFNCKHIFHLDCILKWFKASKASKCPLCRSVTTKLIKPCGEIFDLSNHSKFLKESEEFGESDSNEEEDEEYFPCIICSNEVLQEEDMRICVDCDQYAHEECIRTSNRLGTQPSPHWKCRECTRIHFESTALGNDPSPTVSRSLSQSLNRIDRSRTNSRQINANSSPVHHPFSDPIARQFQINRDIRTSTVTSRPIPDTRALDDMLVCQDHMIRSMEKSLKNISARAGTGSSSVSKSEQSSKMKRKRSSFMDEMESIVGSSQEYGCRSSILSSNKKTASIMRPTTCHGRLGHFFRPSESSHTSAMIMHSQMIPITEIALRRPRDRTGSQSSSNTQPITTAIQARSRCHLEEKYKKILDTLKSVSGGKGSGVSMADMEAACPLLSDVALCLDRDITTLLLDKGILDLLVPFLSPQNVSGDSDEVIFMNHKMRELVMRTIHCFLINKRHVKGESSPIIDTIRACAVLHHQYPQHSHGLVPLIAQRVLKKWEPLLQPSTSHQQAP